MNKFRIWLKAARLRTLPLSLSGIIVGTALANSEGHVNFNVFLLALLTTVFFQITSNFANDYGDGIKGTDDAQRIGPERVLQAGLLTRTELKKGIALSIVISLVLSILLLLEAFGIKNIWFLILFLILAIMSIWSAIKYTMGENPYGYQGLGDVFVFLFFGILAVVGTEFLFSSNLKWISFLPAIAIGLLSTAVLNLNNLRDHVQDKRHNKNTLVVKMGFERGKIYHYFLLSLSFTSLLIFHLVAGISLYGGFYFLAFVPIVFHVKKMNKLKEPSKIDPELKKIALSTFFLSIFFYLAVNYFY